MIFRGIPELLSDSFLLENFLSREKRLNLSKWLRKNLAGITANIALGFFLAFTPIFGSFFGLPLEVRHVTLATGNLTIAFASLPLNELNAGTIILAVSGIFVILLGNLLTSFFLSLWLALRAKGWHLSDVKDVLRSLYSRG
jgi:site-specific recombinase